MNLTLLKPKELGEIFDLKPETILRTKLDTVLIENIHYIRPLGGKKILFIWEHIQRNMLNGTLGQTAVPMSRGGYCHG